MAEASVFQEEFKCAVCLDLLKDPVTIQCGHSYCKSCITGCWDQEDQMRVYSCPQCRQTFSPRPALARNTILAEVVRKRPADCLAEAGDVECDACSERKYKAVKSCVMCLISYCQNHLEVHENLFKRMRHNVTDATGRLQEMICQKHEKPLEIFCHTDQKCICVLCTMDEHKNHNTVSAAEQRTEKQKQLKETQKTFQQRIQQREKDVQQLRETVESHKRSTQTAVEDSERIFTELIRSIERRRSELIRLIRDQEKQALSRAEGRLERLEQEINDLRRRDAELEQLSHTQDHIQFLQRFQSLSAPPQSTDGNDDLFNPLISSDDLRVSVRQLRNKLKDFCKEELKKISDRVTFTNIVPRTRNNLLRYCHQLTLDPNTVNRRLRLSESNKVITYTGTVQSYPDHPDRFEYWYQVLYLLRGGGGPRVATLATWPCLWSSDQDVPGFPRHLGEGADRRHSATNRGRRLLGGTQREISGAVQLSHLLWGKPQALVQIFEQISLLTLLDSVYTSLGSGHPGSQQTLSLICKCYWWPNMARDVARYVRGCSVCVITSTPQQLPEGKLVPLPLPFRPWSHLGVDLATDLPPSKGCTTILVVVDRISKACKLIPLRGLPTALETAEALFHSKMAESRVFYDKFMCAKCLDLMKDPVTIPCGHSYCKSCITGRWDQEDQMRVYSCPQCRQTFSPRPALARNTMLAQVVEKLKKRKRPADCYAGAKDVQCDACKYKAVKSCLVCLNSFCQNHLDQHESILKVKRHNLTDATGRLQEMICQKHKKILEVFCRTDQKCICVQCMDEHKNHDTVLAAEQRTEKQKQLKETQKTFQQRIQQREKDVQQLREAVESHKRSAQTAVEDSERIFTELIHSIERSRSELIRLIRDQEKQAVSRAEGRLERLEQEINDLRRRDAELEQLSHTQDHIQFLQSFQSLSAPPESTDVNDDPFTSPVSSDDLREFVYQLRDELEDFCNKKFKRISDGVTSTNIVPRTRNDFLQYSHQLTLDLNTVNKWLRLSDNNRVITQAKKEQRYPDHPDRFKYWYQVLCEESVCGRSYWEIEWSGTRVFISVSYKSISRKGRGDESGFGSNDQSWSLICFPDKYTFRHNNIEPELPVKPISSRIGVFVDHSAGTLSFYSVSDTMSLIHTVHTTFTQPLYPGFNIVQKGSSVKLCFESE
ncbi:uncharacterized protein [Garra rufa]|uniref:uncharacterized protein n=1 Tax=Garra rufa TaxID=137080 RepID=UPI003CCEDABD